MCSARTLCLALRPFGSVILAALLFACGGGGGDSDSPDIAINVPTTAPTYATVWTDVRLGGSISGASFVHASNAATGATAEGFVFYNQGVGSWFVDIQGLTFGDNPITVVADEDGQGLNTATDTLTVVRPAVPLERILNGADAADAKSHWVDAHSLFESHRIALYADGTGRSTTGSVFSEAAGAAVDITWTLQGPDEVLIVGCADCSFQRISRISGALEEELFLGQVESLGGVGEIALHAFILVQEPL